jgi:signal transduction histidine kinase
MTGTNDSTGGLRRFTRLGPRWNARLAIFALAAGLVVLLIVWIQRSVGNQMAGLEQEFGTVKAESFYLGVQARVRFRRLNEQLLDYHLSQTPGDRESFLTDADKLQRWLASSEVGLTTARERELFHQMRDAYGRYLAGMRPLVRALDQPAAPAAFRTTYQVIREESRPLIGLIEKFVEAQQDAFNAFLETSQETLLSLRRLLALSMVLLLASTVALAVLIYRGMIAPLRREVSESRALVERQEKLASLGTLAAGVAHEIRNPLTAIKFRLFSLRQSLPPEFAENEDAGVISGEINRLDRIVKEFLQFARPSEPSAVRVPAERIVQEVHDLLSSQLEKSAIQLRLETHGATWVHADTQQIKQVLINLIQNAADSIGRQGVISLRVTQGTSEFTGSPRPAAILQVADTGQGIPPEVRKRLFDPFFSTKEGGTGLGLAIAARIIERHGGLLRYRTEAQRGTTFEIVLPRLEDHATQTPDH